MGQKINLKNVRIGWVNVFDKAPDQTDDSGNLLKGKFQLTGYLPEDHPQIDQLEDTVREVLAEAGMEPKAIDKWIDRNYGFGNHSDKCAVRDLAERDKPIEGMEEGLYFKATNQRKPKIQTSKGENQVEPGLVFAPGKDDDGDEIEGKEVYAGCYANLSLEVYWMDKFKNLCISLLGLRFRKDGVEFKGTGESATDDDLADDEDDAPRKSKSSASKRRRDPEDDEDDSSNRKSSRRRRRSEEDDE